jgi:hypothetical protein
LRRLGVEVFFNEKVVTVLVERLTIAGGNRIKLFNVNFIGPFVGRRIDGVEVRLKFVRPSVGQ